MVWVPDWKWEQMQQQRKGGKGGKGGGCTGSIWQQQQKPPWRGGGGGGSKGKGGGGGKGGWKKQPIRDTSKVVWIGGLPEDVDFKELKEHGLQAGEAKWAEVFGKGTGCIGYGSEDEVQTAIAMLTGTELKGAIITADVWEKTPKTS
uniref:RRM domain-containing protein n=1 Tax=Alexandrium monilatum TaxID=311494 RepID=A0A7S4STF5_9DINO